MQLRHERRRRLFSDDAPDVSSDKIIPLSGGHSSRADQAANAYTEGAQRARERAVCSLLPARLFTLSLAVSGCLMLVGVCLALHAAYPTVATLLPADDVAFLQLHAAGAIGRWLASTLLATSGALALIIYSLRRHRIDDYHGRYRMWIWVFAVCLLASLTETTGLGQLARAMCRRAAQWCGVQSDVLWSTSLGLVLAAIGLRLLFEIRRSRGAVTTLVACAVALLIAVAGHTIWPAEWPAAGQPLLARGAWLSGYVLVLATFLLYARYIQLEVDGAVVAPIKRKTRRPKSRTRDEVESNSPSEPPAKPRLRVQTDLDPVETTVPEEPPRAQSTVDVRKTVDAQSDSDASGESKPKRLSKAERRRQRREARTTRMAG